MRASGRKRERKRFQSRSPAGPEITLYSAARMASMLSTSFGFAAGIAAGAVDAEVFSCADDRHEKEIVKATSVATASKRNLMQPPCVFSRTKSIETDFYVGAFFKMHGVDEAHLAIVERENHGLQTNALAEKAHAAKKISIGDAGAGENHFLSRREVGGVVNSFGILDAHFLETLRILRLGHD